MPTLDCPIPKDAWRVEHVARNGTPGNPHMDAWGAWVAKLLRMQELGDNWDGLGAPAPSRALIQSAIGLAHLLCEKGVEPPQIVAAGTDGSIDFGWQDDSGNYAAVEVIRPYFAEVMVIEPGKPARHWTLPTE
ncbi:MAG: hypothetical protein HYX68_10855 [Planctomycetes bacterium]|nr:hypothetical protein [Planctomycetota bacterium]